MMAAITAIVSHLTHRAPRGLTFTFTPSQAPSMLPAASTRP